MQAYAEERRIALIQLGGRPTRAIQWDAGPCGFIEGIDDTSSGEEDDTQRESRWLLHHWSLEGGQFALEVDAWQNFRRFQQHIRTKPVPLRERRVEDYWNERGIKEALKPQLHDDLEQESKVNEWKEYYWYRHRQLPAYEKKITERERQKERWLQLYDTAALQTSSNDKPPGTAWFRGRWQSREDVIETGDCVISQATRDRNNHQPSPWPRSQFESLKSNHQSIETWGTAQSQPRTQATRCLEQEQSSQAWPRTRPQPSYSVLRRLQICKDENTNDSEKTQGIVSFVWSGSKKRKVSGVPGSPNGATSSPDTYLAQERTVGSKKSRW
ncbi:MAG: hypothetical protein LQ344_006231 [Seirophora lacunosa]|nr:MAG: hypothetical protein LQ344_006231 [Seirophora lacunosa]